MRIVVDTNVVVSGLYSSRGASHQILRIIPDEKFKMLVSVPLFFEYESVLKRGKFGLTAKEVDNILNVIAKFAEKVEPYFLWRPFLVDPNDDMLLELAVAGGADAIISFNKKDFSEVENKFGIKIMSTKEFYEEVLL